MSSSHLDIGVRICKLDFQKCDFTTFEPLDLCTIQIFYIVHIMLMISQPLAHVDRSHILLFTSLKTGTTHTKTNKQGYISDVNHPACCGI